jgi:Zn-finger nucleic acid-binding protein
MKCASCSKGTREVEYEGVTLDVCAGCGSAWLDGGELKTIIKVREKRFTPAEIKAIRGVDEKILTKVDSIKGRYHCPKCDKQMDRINYGVTSGVLIDKCASGHGIFLDGGELEAVQILAEQWSEKLGEDLQKYGPAVRKVKQDLDERLGEATKIRGRMFKGRSRVLTALVEFLIGSSLLDV